MNADKNRCLRRVSDLLRRWGTVANPGEAGGCTGARCVSRQGAKTQRKRVRFWRALRLGEKSEFPGLSDLLRRWGTVGNPGEPGGRTGARCVSRQRPKTQRQRVRSWRALRLGEKSEFP